MTEFPESFSFKDLVKKERASIVNIRSNTFSREGTGPLKDFFRLGDYLNDEVKSGSLGTGFIFHDSGLILTNYHVIAPPPQYQVADEIVIHLFDQRKFPATVVGTDKKIDIALLRIEGAKPFPAVELGDSQNLNVGEWVMAVGNPFGIETLITVGVVSGVGRVVGAGPYDHFIQTDALIHSGNTGGPLYNIRGQVIGINTTVSIPDIGIGFAIPIDMIKKVLPMLEADGKITRGWLGVMVQTLTNDLAKAFHIEGQRGALVSEVMDRSPAQKAGILRGDIIVNFGGEAVNKMRDLPSLVANTPVGERVPLGLIRDGKQIHLEVEIDRMIEEE
ncbi:MAG: S1C family serine protease [Nitrospiria bacterium]